MNALGDAIQTVQISNGFTHGLESRVTGQRARLKHYAP